MGVPARLAGGTKWPLTRADAPRAVEEKQLSRAALRLLRSCPGEFGVSITCLPKRPAEGRVILDSHKFLTFPQEG